MPKWIPNESGDLVNLDLVTSIAKARENCTEGKPQTFCLLAYHAVSHGNSDGTEIDFSVLASGLSEKQANNTLHNLGAYVGANNRVIASPELAQLMQRESELHDEKS